MSTNPTSRAWVEIDPAALRRNLATLRDRVGPTAPIVAMVKADAYGLGAVQVARSLGDGVQALGVATVEEGRTLRDAGVDASILVFGPLPPGVEPALIEARLEPTISDLASLERVRQAAEAAETVVPVHIEIDTGMGRAGFRVGEIEEWLEPLRKGLTSDAVRWAGLFTHPHSADAPGAPGFREQLARFEAVVERMNPPEGVACHPANSAAAFLPGSGDPRIGGVRAGIFLYGGGIGPELPDPESVVAVRARVVRTVDAAPGETVGYGATHEAVRPERWATLAIGYGDGIPRALSNQGRALVDDTEVAIIGRLSMDLTVLDVSQVADVTPGDIATLIGRSPSRAALIPLDRVAEQAGTISWEVLAGLSPRLPRVWIVSDG